MNAQWSEKDIEGLLAGRKPTAGDLECLTPLVEALRFEAAAAPTPERTAKIVQALAEAARDAVGSAPVRRPRPSVPWRRRLIVVGGVAALVTVGVGGVAVAADGAAPGDLLYPVDQAFEAVGIGRGGTDERLEEALRLAERGNPERALEHAAKAFEAEGDEASAGALAQAAVAVQNQGSEQSVQVKAQVTEMLQWMGSEDPEGQDFGQGVSERAQGIKDTASRGKSDDAPGQNKDDDTATGDTATDTGDTTDDPEEGKSSNGRPSDNPGRGNKKD